MNNDLSLLADRAGVAVEKLSEAAQFAAIGNATAAIFLLAVLSIGGLVCNRLRRTEPDDATFITAIQGIVSALLFVIALCCFYDALTAYLYPEFWTLKSLLRCR